MCDIYIYISPFPTVRILIDTIRYTRTYIGIYTYYVTYTLRRRFIYYYYIVLLYYLIVFPRCPLADFSSHKKRTYNTPLSKIIMNFFHSHAHQVIQ